MRAVGKSNEKKGKRWGGGGTDCQLSVVGRVGLCCWIVVSILAGYPSRARPCTEVHMEGSGTPDVGVARERRSHSGGEAVMGLRRGNWVKAFGVVAVVGLVA